jgi:hypothetical protein
MPDRPGMLAQAAEALGRAGINIEGICGFPCEDRGVVHVLVEDVAAATDVLSEAGIEVTDEREVIVVDIDDRPGTLGSRARAMAETGVNIDLVYLTTKGRLVLGVNDVGRVSGAL